MHASHVKKHCSATGVGLESLANGKTMTMLKLLIIIPANACGSEARVPVRLEETHWEMSTYILITL